MPDAVLRSRCSAFEARRLEGGDAGGEIIEPGDQLRMGGAPFPLEAQIKIAERAGQRDFADSRAIRESGRRGFQRGETAANLAVLMRQPVGVAAFFGAIAPFVDLKQGG